MPAMVRWATTTILVWSASILLGGCSGPGATASITVVVRNATTHAPVVGAAVHVRSLHFHIPAPPYAKFGGGEQLSATVVTDNAGQAIVPSYLGLPLQVIVTTRDTAPLIHVLELPPRAAADGEDAWHGDRAPGQDGPEVSPLEIRVKTPSRRR